MITVLIKTESHYRVDLSRVRETIAGFLREKGVRGNCEVSLSVVGDRLMRRLNSQYRNLNESAVILSFPFTDEKGRVPFASPPDDVLRLGEIVISYPQVRELAIEENKLIDDKIDELVLHGIRHLLGNESE